MSTKNQLPGYMADLIAGSGGYRGGIPNGATVDAWGRPIGGGMTADQERAMKWNLIMNKMRNQQMQQRAQNNPFTSYGLGSMINNAYAGAMPGMKRALRYQDDQRARNFSWGALQGILNRQIPGSGGWNMVDNATGEKYASITPGQYSSGVESRPDLAMPEADLEKNKAAADFLASVPSPVSGGRVPGGHSMPGGGGPVPPGVWGPGDMPSADDIADMPKFRPLRMAGTSGPARPGPGNMPTAVPKNSRQAGLNQAWQDAASRVASGYSTDYGLAANAANRSMELDSSMQRAGLGVNAMGLGNRQAALRNAFLRSGMDVYRRLGGPAAGRSIGPYGGYAARGYA